MVDLSRIFALRPKNETATELRGAEQRARAELESLNARVAEIEARRAHMLLDAPRAEAEKAEAELASAKDAVARVAEMLGVLGERAEAAERREQAEGLLKEIEGLTRESAAVGAEIAKTYPDLAARIADLLRRERELDIKRDMIGEKIKVAKESGLLSADLDLPRRPITFYRGENGTVVALAESVRLPRIGEHPVFWPLWSWGQT